MSGNSSRVNPSEVYAPIPHTRDNPHVLEQFEIRFQHIHIFSIVGYFIDKLDMIDPFVKSRKSHKKYLAHQKASS